MNERIKALADQAGVVYHTRLGAETNTDDLEKFAELIVRECKETFAKVWYKQGLDIQGAELGKFLKQFEEHFGVEE